MNLWLSLKLARFFPLLFATHHRCQTTNNSWENTYKSSIVVKIHFQVFSSPTNTINFPFAPNYIGLLLSFWEASKYNIIILQRTSDSSSLSQSLLPFFPSSTTSWNPPRTTSMQPQELSSLCQQPSGFFHTLQLSSSSSFTHDSSLPSSLST